MRSSVSVSTTPSQSNMILYPWISDDFFFLKLQAFSSKLPFHPEAQKRRSELYCPDCGIYTRSDEGTEPQASNRGTDFWVWATKNFLAVSLRASCLSHLRDTWSCDFSLPFHAWRMETHMTTLVCVHIATIIHSTNTVGASSAPGPVLNMEDKQQPK